MLKIILIITFMLITICNLYTQSSQLSEKKNYKQCIIGLKDFKKRYGTDLIISTNSIQFQDKITKKPVLLPFDDIKYLRVQTGNKAGQYALYGGLFSAAICLSVIIDINTDPEYELNSNATPVFAGLIGAGVVVGAIIGSLVPDWKTYYLPNQLSINKFIKPTIYANSNSIGLIFEVKLN